MNTSILSEDTPTNKYNILTKKGDILKNSKVIKSSFRRPFAPKHIAPITIRKKDILSNRFKLYIIIPIVPPKNKFY